MKALLLPAGLLILLLSSPGPSPAVGQAEGEWARSYSVYLPGLEPTDASGAKTVVSVRLMRLGDDHLCSYVPHGTVSFHTEECLPRDTASRFLAEGKGDEFGFVNVFRPKKTGEHWESGSHWHFEAPGQGAEHDFTTFGHFPDEEVILPGGVDREIRVIDPFGRPLAGATVSMYLGCPHSPALRSGETDGRGIVRLANLPVDRDGDFWIEAPAIRFGPYSLAPPWVGQGGPTILTEPARTARGTVVDEEGTPVAGVVIRATGDYPRGPVTVADAEGTFVLHGVGSRHRLCFYRPDSPHAPRPDAIVFDFEQGVPLRVTLLPSRPTSPTDGEPRHAVDVVPGRTRDWKLDGKTEKRWEEARGVPVALSRRADGFTVRGTAGDGGFRALVPPGNYLVSAGGGFSSYRARQEEHALPRPHGEQVRVELPGDQPGVGIDIRDLRAEGHPLPGTIELRIPGAVKDLSDRHQFYGLRVPPGPVGLMVSPPDRVLPAGDGGFTIDSPPKNRIRFRLADRDGKPLEPEEVTVDWDDLTPEKLDDGSWVVGTWACGRVSVEFGGFFGKRVAVDLPSKEAGLVDLGTVVLPNEDEEPPEALTIFLRFANGDPVTEDDLHWCSLRAYDDGEEWETPELEEDGSILVEDRRGAFSVSIEGPRLYPLSTVVRPDGPGEIRLPAGELTGELRGPDGEAVPGVVYVDSARYECPKGRLAVRGVPAGPHLVIAGAKGHMGEVRRIVLAEGETRDLCFDLPSR